MWVDVRRESGSIQRLRSTMNTVCSLFLRLGPLQSSRSAAVLLVALALSVLASCGRKNDRKVTGDAGSGGISNAAQNTTGLAGIAPGSGGSVTNSAIHEAAKDGDLEKVKALLKSNPDCVLSKGTDDATPLHWAALNGHKEVAALLLANKAEVNAKSKSGGMPLHTAAFRGYKDLAALLLADGADVNGKANDERTPLHAAAMQGHKDLVALLLAGKAEIDAKDKTGRTPLHLAAANGQKDMVELLLAKGANVNSTEKIMDMTPLLMMFQMSVEPPPHAKA